MTQQIMVDAAAPSNQLDLTAGEASRSNGRAFFDSHKQETLPVQYDHFLGNMGFTEDCKVTLSTVSAYLAMHKKAREELAAASQ